MIEIVPSILSADFCRLGEQIAQVEAAGATMLHLDVMDGHFVPNMTIGPPVIRSIRRATRLILDVHLMIADGQRWAPQFIEAGADCISIHQEACPHLDRAIRFVQSEGVRAGVVLNPSTPVMLLTEVLDLVDFVLLMSVNPGFGGQKMIPAVLNKASQLRALREQRGLKFAIEIDGGITLDNVGEAARAGVDWIVAGISVFGQPDPAAAFGALTRAAREAVSLRA
jgi:ribulose-phosphate 3-epimerase